MGKNLVFVCLSFFVFDAKSGTITYTHRNRSSNIYYRPFSRNLNYIKKFRKVFSVSRKTGLKFLIFRLDLSE